MNLHRLLSIFLLFLFFTYPPFALAAQTSQQTVDDLTAKLKTTQNQATTLSNMVTYFNTAIALNQQNTQTMHALQASVNTDQKTLQAKQLDPFADISWNDMAAYPFYTIKYTVIIFVQKYILKKQKQATAVDVVGTAKKKELQDLSERLALQQVQLEQLKAAKAYLLSVTQNDEKKYQDLLTSAQEELQAQKAIFAGKANEVKVGLVKPGDTIGQIISGASACSTGTHLHFEMRQDNNPIDPAQYLKTVAVRYTSPLERQEQFMGTWSWPITLPAVITQEFGMSWFARPGGFSARGAYNGAQHTGIDLVSDSGTLSVFAPTNGTLYVGSEACGGGQLRYLRIVHSPTLSSYYLHTSH